MKKNLLIAVVLVTVAVLSRLVSHEWNFTAMGAAALAAGLLIQNRLLALLVPMTALLISDAVIGFHNVMWAVYLGYFLMVVCSSSFSQKISVKNVLSSALLGSFIFFAVSNFGVWIEGQLYPLTFSGFVACYEMAVPFFKNEIISNMLLTPVLVYGIRLIISTLSVNTEAIGYNK